MRKRKQNRPDRQSKSDADESTAEEQSRSGTRADSAQRRDGVQRTPLGEPVAEPAPAHPPSAEPAPATPEPATVPGGVATPSPGERARRKRDRNIQRSLEGTDTSRDEVPEQVLEVIGSGGMPLDPSLQRALEERMDADFSDVRIHTGAKAAEAADAIDAKAFTCGNDIVFNDGEYAPKSPEGRFLLVHELAHVKQQNGSAPISMMPKEDADLEVDPDPQLEQEAEKTAHRVIDGREFGIQRLADTGVHVQRTKSVEQLKSKLNSEQKRKAQLLLEETEEYDDIEELLSQLNGQLTGLNHKLMKKGKISEEIPAEDIIMLTIPTMDNSPRPHYLLETDKWKDDLNLSGDGMHDSKHIVARHIPHNDEDEWPTSYDAHTDSETTMFPDELTYDEMISVIELTIRNGYHGKDKGELIYDGSELQQYGIEEMVIRRNPTLGVVQSAFPTKLVT